MAGSTPPRPPRSGQLLRFVIGVLIAGVVAWYLVSHRRDLVHLRGVPPLLLVLLVIGRTAAMALLQWASLILLRVFAPAIRLSEYLLLVVGGSVADHFIPLGGLSSKALYLHRRHAISPGQLVSAMAYQGVVRFLLGGILAAILLSAMPLLLADNVGQQVGPLHWLATSISLLGGLVPLLLLGPLSRVGKRLRPIARLAEGWDTLVHTRRIGLQVAASALLAMLLSSLIFACLWSTMLPTSSPAVGALVSLLIVPFKVIRFTPGNLGTQEGTIGLLGRSFGVPVSIGAAISVVGRLLGVGSLLLLATVVTLGRWLRRDRVHDGD